ncbi:uncharacterized protein LOC128223105 [Mya arenaria]|uniref:uncharacterized protein LOC128223105 n=1 Tax=Mya arenaria TaxID=6604 RepID=UPI0022E28B48|nr:uncharacterized protein LOC128223105 [Mya arenaria]
MKIKFIGREMQCYNLDITYAFFLARLNMNTVTFVALALVAVVGLATAQFDGYYGYPSYPGVGPVRTGGSGLGNGGFLALIGMLVLFMALFGNNSGTSDQIILVNSTLEG